MSPAPFASLRAALEEAIAGSRPVAAFGCLPFTPDRDFTRTVPAGPLTRTSDDKPARGNCPICGRPLHLAAPAPAPGGPAYLDCAGCNRASVRVEAGLVEQLRRDQQRRHLVAHNRQLTADTPVPAILVEPDPEPEPSPAPKSSRKGKRPKEAQPC